MFKVSFKETEKMPYKVVPKTGLNTLVTLRGKMEIPYFWKHIPEDIQEWIANQTKVELYENVAENTILVFAEGTSRCRKDDKYNTLIGERLAESRAKHDIYKFLHTLCYKLAEYYGAILYGNGGPVVDSPKEGIMADVHKYEQLYMRELRHQRELLEEKNHG